MHVLTVGMFTFAMCWGYLHWKLPGFIWFTQEAEQPQEEGCPSPCWPDLLQQIPSHQKRLGHSPPLPVTLKSLAHLSLLTSFKETDKQVSGNQPGLHLILACFGRLEEGTVASIRGLILQPSSPPPQSFCISVPLALLSKSSCPSPCCAQKLRKQTHYLYSDAVFLVLLQCLLLNYFLSLHLLVPDNFLKSAS